MRRSREDVASDAGPRIMCVFRNKIRKANKAKATAGERETIPTPAKRKRGKVPALEPGGGEGEGEGDGMDDFIIDDAEDLNWIDPGNSRLDVHSHGRGEASGSSRLGRDVEEIEDDDEVTIEEWAYTMRSEPPSKRRKSGKGQGVSAEARVGMSIVREDDNEVWVLSD